MILKPVMDALAPVMQELANALIEMAVPYIMLWAEAIFNLIPCDRKSDPVVLRFCRHFDSFNACHIIRFGYVCKIIAIGYRCVLHTNGWN